MSERPEPAPPESIERDGVSYVPRLWLQSGRDALDTCCNQLTATERDLAAALARAEALRERAIRAEVARAEAEARVRELESAYQAASSLLRASATRANAAEARVREWADEYAFERDLASQRGSRITVLEAKVWALIAAGDNLSRWAHHGPACWVTIGGPGDGRCTCGVSEHASAWKKAKEGQA